MAETENSHVPWQQALGIPMVRRYIAGYALDVIGDILMFLVLSWALLHRFGASPAALVLLLIGISGFLLTPVGGALIDRFGLARIATFSMSGRIVAVALWAWAVVKQDTPLWVFLILALVFGALDGVHRPAIANWPTSVAATEGLENAQRAIMMWEKISVRCAYIVSGVLGGIILSTLRPSTAIALAVVILVLALLVFLPLVHRVPSTPVELDEDEVRLLIRPVHAMKVVQREPIIRRMLPVLGVYNALTAGLSIVAIPLKAQNDHWSAGVAFAAFAAWGLGLLIGLFATPIWVKHTAHTLRTGLILAGLVACGIAAFGLVDNPYLAIVIIAVTGWCSGPIGTLCMAYIREFRVGREDAGALSSLEVLAVGGIEPLGYVAFATLSTAGNLTKACLGIAAGMLLIIGWALAEPRIRSYLDPESPAGATSEALS